MHEHLLPEVALGLLAQLTTLHPPPQSIWLIGSRANGRHHAKSDTDLLVFADALFASTARSALPAPCNIDVLVTHDGDNFSDVWQQKTGSLRSWRWAVRDATTASYLGLKFLRDVDDEDDSPQRDDPDIETGAFIERSEVALLVWERAV